MITVYTDGGCYNNGDKKGLGSYAFLSPVFRDKSNSVVVIGEKLNDTTNNRTEMLAIINAIKYHNGDTIKIITDSGYVVKGWTKPSYLETWQKNGWITSTKKPVANKDLWLELVKLRWHRQFIMRLMRGHNKDKDIEKAFWNDICDRACTFLMNDNNVEYHKTYELEYLFDTHEFKIIKEV